VHTDHAPASLIDDPAFVATLEGFEEAADPQLQRWEGEFEGLDRGLAAALPDCRLGQFDAGEPNRPADVSSRAQRMGRHIVMVTTFMVLMGLGATVAALVFHARVVQILAH